MKLVMAFAATLICSAAAAAPTDPNPPSPNAPAPNPMIAFGAAMGSLQGGWRADCTAGGGDSISTVKTTVVFTLDAAGQLAGEPVASSDDQGPVAKAAMARAIVAVKQAVPFKTLPPMFYGKTYHVVFDGHVACPAAPAR
jgi:hypothetical protein